MPGPSFCWGPELEGPRSPSSSRSSTRGQAGRDRRGCAARAPPPPPTRNPSTPPTPRTDPAPSRRFAPPTRRVARFACTSPPSALVCAGAQFCPPTSTRVGGGAPMRRDGGAAARVGREGAWEPGWGAGGSLGVRRGSSKAGRLAHKNRWLQWADFFCATCGQILGRRIAQ